jgi:hypothetical protein
MMLCYTNVLTVKIICRKKMLEVRIQKMRSTMAGSPYKTKTYSMNSLSNSTKER